MNIEEIVAKANTIATDLTAALPDCGIDTTSVAPMVHEIVNYDSTTDCIADIQVAYKEILVLIDDIKEKNITQVIQDLVDSFNKIKALIADCTQKKEE